MNSTENDRSTAGNARNSADNGSTTDSEPTASLKEHLHVAQDAKAPENDLPDKRPAEHGGQAGLEPTRYGDWEKKGRCTDF